MQEKLFEDECAKRQCTSTDILFMVTNCKCLTIKSMNNDNDGSDLRLHIDSDSASPSYTAYFATKDKMLAQAERLCCQEFLPREL